MTSIIAVKEPTMIFGPIPGYQSRQTQPIRRPPSIRCSPTRKRAQYRKKKEQHFDPSPRKDILPRLVGENSVLESEIYFSSFSVLVDAKA